MPEHVDITDPEIHEPKGVTAASAGTLYIADGTGSGSWATAGSSSISASLLTNINKFTVDTSFPDLSTATDLILIPIPFACTLNRATSILHGPIAGANKSIAFTNAGGPSIGNITVAFSGSAEGDRDTLNASTNNVFTAGSYLKIASSGASTGAVKLNILLEFTRT